MEKIILSGYQKFLKKIQKISQKKIISSSIEDGKVNENGENINLCFDGFLRLFDLNSVCEIFYSEFINNLYRNYLSHSDNIDDINNNDINVHDKISIEIDNKNDVSNKNENFRITEHSSISYEEVPKNVLQWRILILAHHFVIDEKM